jgi:hypothetical protein
MKRRMLLSAVAAALAIFGGSLIVPGTAHATHAEGVITGFDDPTNDWADEGTMSSSSHRYSIATGLWQHVLYADGYLSASDVDCDFGPRTTTATKAWQSDHGVGVDGKVGPQTLGRADDKLRISGFGSTVEDITYTGRVRSVSFVRWKPGNPYGLAGTYVVVAAGDRFLGWPAYYHRTTSDC